MKLTQAEVDAATSEGRPRRELYDGRGLMLMVLASGKKTWFARYTRDGRPTQRKLGHADETTERRASSRMLLEDARRAAQLVIKPPAPDPMQAELAAIREDNAALHALVESLRGDIRELASKLIGAQATAYLATGHTPEAPKLTHGALSAGDNGERPSRYAVAALVERYKTLQNPTDAWRSVAKCHVVPMFGELEAAAIKPRDLAPKLNAIESDNVLGNARRVLRDALALALADGEIASNPAADPLTPLLRKNSHRTTHHAALPWGEAPSMYATLGSGPAALCIRLQMLTALRPTEARGARWDEIDTDKALWVIPAERMKGKREHVVPLSGEALAVLAQCDKSSEYVFASTRKEGEIARASVIKLLKRVAPGKTLHGLRSTFRDWTLEVDADYRTCELALAHTVGTAVEQAYARNDLLERRRSLLAQWADYLAGGSA